ncbi:MAG: hypothetical protein HPY79_06180 [Bacteroidales bacterium]|nr:hypothetical protein [Bacteroidales bacterium]
MLGKNIQQSGDLLAKISFDQLINIIKGEYKPLIHQIEELRRIQTIDVQAYRKLKTMLPYFTVSIFNPPHRRTENFAYSHYLIIDIDHLSKQNLTPNQVKKQIASNTNVLCAFTSPSNEGLKILFKLQPRINDIALYKNFYKLFAIKFAQQYQFEELIDLKTCDATRATFLSFDPEVFVNYQSLAINYNEFINLDNTLEIEQLQKQIIAYEKNHPTTQTQQTTLSDDILLNIKQKLNPNYKQPQKIPYVPEKLNAIIPSIVTQLEQQGLFIEKIENIQYGKKLKICLQHRWCEINIFYGKKGFSAVRTPKNGSDGELGLIVLQFIQQLLSI